MSESSLAQRIDALLPQTQCTRCGYPACRDYAVAIADDGVDINRCPPGGAAGIALLATLLRRPAQPLDTTCGVEKPREVAVIDEARCIGCTKCIQACPVDAIVGANKVMHTVLAAACSGCELCVAPCPVDCIALVPAPDDGRSVLDRAPQYRARYVARNARLRRESQEASAELAASKAATSVMSVNDAVARARARKAARSGAA